MTGRFIIAFLTDVNVPDSVGNFLRERGHDVERVREVMPADSPDPVVAEAAMQAGRILVSWDRDFNQQRFRKPRFDTLSRIGFSCPEPLGVRRLGEVIDLIEFHAAATWPAAPLSVLIGGDKILFRA
jgi:hypothetical protein